MTRSTGGELVKDVCTRVVKACGPEDTLAEAAARMCAFDCGVMPVVDEGRRLLGLLTDRDICMAVTIRDQRASQLRVREAMTGELALCGPDDGLPSALERMARARVRRLPVVDGERVLVGILSITDVLRRAPGAAALETLRAIGEPSAEDQFDEIGWPAAATTR